MPLQVVACEHYFEDATRFRKWVVEQFSLGNQIITEMMDDQAQAWTKVDSGKNQQDTFKALNSLLLDRGAHMTEAISKLKPGQVCNYLAPEILLLHYFHIHEIDRALFRF